MAMDAALDKQAEDILMLDIHEVSAFADYLVICTAESQRQTKAISDEIDRVLGQAGIVIVHVFAPDERQYYDLESLWSTGTPVVRIL